MTSSWSPKRTIQEGEFGFKLSPLELVIVVYLPFTANEILCAPGSLHEMETALVAGQVHRIYKNIWPSLRVFWLLSAQKYKDAICVVFENQRYTFRQIFERSLKAAAMFRDVYRVNKGGTEQQFLLFFFDTQD